MTAIPAKTKGENPFKTYYVYEHVDPRSGAILYIGMGTGSRAYATKTTKAKQSAYGHRSPEHSKHLDELLKEGYLPHEWINFPGRGLTKEEALSFEKELIKEISPLYNKKQGVKSLKFSREDILEMKHLRYLGYYYSDIAKEMGCSTMVAHRIVNDLSPRYKELLNEN